MRASFVLSEIGIGLRRNLTMTVAMIVTVTISLVLVGTGLLIALQVNTTKGYWYDKVEVSIYLCGASSNSVNCNGTAISDQQRSELQRDLQATPLVEKVYYESTQQAYERFKEQFKDSPDLVNNVTPDALPESFRVKLKDATQFEVVASAFRDRPGVDEVQDQKALLGRLFKIMHIVQWGTLIVALAELAAALLLIYNTIRVSAFSRRRETGIMRLVGASNLYIQLPFLLEGLLAGVVGAALAAGGLALLKAFAIDRILRVELPITAWVGWDSVVLVIGVLFVTSLVLSGLASVFTLRRHLRV